MKPQFNQIQINDESSKPEFEDHYLEDFYRDETCLAEDLDPYEGMLDGTAANEDIWDMLEVNALSFESDMQ